MPDINVQVTDVSDINVQVNDNPISISASILGTQGPTGPNSAGGGSNVQVTGSSTLSNVNITGTGNVSVITIGTLTYISGSSASSTNGYPSDNPANFSTSGNLQNTGINLQNSINLISGNLNTSGQNLYQAILGLSGLLSGNIQTTGQNLFNLLNNYTGYQNNNPSGFIRSIDTGNFDSNLVHKTGTEIIVGGKIFSFDDVVTIISGNTIQTAIIQNSSNQVFFDIENLDIMDGNGLVSIGPMEKRLYSSGTNFVTVDWFNHRLYDTGLSITLDWQNKILSGNWSGLGTLRINGNIVTTGGPYYSSDNPSGFITSFVAGVSVTGVSITGGNAITGLFNINAGSNITLTQNGNNTLSIASTAAGGGGGAAITGLSITGDLYSSGVNGKWNISGKNNIYVLKSGNNDIFISGDTSALATASNLQGTGSNLYVYITSLSGAEDTKIANINNLTGTFYPYNNPSNFANSGNLQSTGSNLQASINSINNLTGTFYPYNNPQNYISTGNADNRYVDLINNQNIFGNKVLHNTLSISGSGQYLALQFLNNNDLKLIHSGIIADNCWSLGMNNTILGAGFNDQVVIGNNNSSQNFVGTIVGVGNNIVMNEDGSIFGENNTMLNGASSQIVGFGNTIQDGSQNIIFGLSNTVSGTNLGAVGLSLINKVDNTLDLGTSNTTKVSIGTNNTLFRTPIILTGINGVSGIFLTGYNIVALNNLTISGNTVVTGGPYYTFDNPSNFANSGNIQSTGQTLYTYITNTSGNLDTRLYQTGSNLLALISASAAGVSSISVTGHAVQSGSINFTGAGNVTVLTGINNTIIFSGDISTLATIINLASTGSTLYNDIVSLSGVGNNTITNLQSTGSNLYNLINNFSGVFNSSGTQYTNSINTLTTNLASTGSTLQSKISLLQTYTGVSITGLGTNNYIPRFTSDGTGLVNSSIIDSGTNISTMGITLTGNTLVANSGNVTVGTPILDLNQGWNAAGVLFTGIKMNITDQASSNSSNLIDLRVANTSKLNIDKFGQLTATNIKIAFQSNGGGQFNLFDGSSQERASISTNGLQLSSGNNGTPCAIKWTNNILDNQTVDLVLWRETSDTLTMNLEQVFPVTQTIKAADAIHTGINISGSNFIIAAGRSVGTGLGGKILFQTSQSTGVSGSALNPLITRMIIDSTGFIGINTLNPISSLDITGNIISSGITATNYIAQNNLNLISNNTNTGIILSGNTININQNYTFLSGSGTNLYILSNPVLTGILAGTNITVQNNTNGSFTINSAAAGVTGIYISGGNSHSGAIQFTGSNGISIVDSGNNVFLYTLPNFSKSLTLEYPVAGDSITLFYTDAPLKVNKLITLLSGDTNQTLDFNIRLSTGRNVSPYYSLFNSTQTTTSINTGTLYTSFNNNVISGNSYVWLDILATGGNLYKFSETLFYNYI